VFCDVFVMCVVFVCVQSMSRGGWMTRNSGVKDFQESTQCILSFLELRFVHYHSLSRTVVLFGHSLLVQNIISIMFYVVVLVQGRISVS
jgi:hypothetical protein